MGIYVLIIICIYTMLGVTVLASGVNDNDPADILIGLIITITGIIGIIFQSISL